MFISDQLVMNAFTGKLHFVVKNVSQLKKYDPIFKM